MSFTDSLDFADSFAHYTQAQILQKWDAQSQVNLDSTHGRGGRECVQMGTSGDAGHLTRTFTLFSSGAWTVGFAYQIQANGTYNNNIYVNSGSMGTFLNLQLTPDGGIALFANTALIGLGKTVLYIGAWYYFEVQLFAINTATISVPGHINVTAGLHVNGILEIASTTVNSGINTAAGSGAAISNTHSFQGPNSAFTGCYLQDIYICDTGGFDELNYLGDVKVVPYFPVSDAAGNAWVGSPFTSPNTYKNINSNPANDSDNITSTTVGQVSSFLPQTISGFTGTIEGVHSVIRGQGGSTETVALVLGPPGSFAAGRVQGLAIGSFRFSTQGWIKNIDPSVNAAWTVANFNAENFGIEETHT